MIPQFLSHLRVYGNYPVPFVQMWIEGKPDFRAVDPSKVESCVYDRLCAICGRRLGEFCFLIGGEAARVNDRETHPLGVY